MLRASRGVAAAMMQPSTAAMIRELEVGARPSSSLSDFDNTETFSVGSTLQME